MKALVVESEWVPRNGTSEHHRDIEGVRAQQGSRVWMHPRISVQSLPDPEPRPGEVLIKARACGLCGSDVAMVSADSEGYVLYPYMMSSPIVIGHEPSGEIVATGKHVRDFRVGDPVTAQCVINCFTCSMCRKSRYDECEHNEERGFTVNGACAEYFVADARHVHSLTPLVHLFSDEKLYSTGSVIEPLAGTYKALKESGVDKIPIEDLKEGSALVIGAGPIGIAAMMNLQALGFGTVLVAEISPERMAHVDSLGGVSIDSLRSSFAEHILHVTAGRGVLVVFEASGALKAKKDPQERNLWEEIRTLFDRQKEQPRLIFFGQSKEDIPINPQLFIQKYAILTGSHGHTGVWPDVIQMVAQGCIEDPTRMITKKISLSEVPEVLRHLQHEKHEMKITITDFTH